MLKESARSRNIWRKDLESEADASPPIRYRISWDTETRTMRFPLVEGDTKTKVRAYLEAHPDASGNEVMKALGTGRNQTLDAVREIKTEGGTPD